MTHRLPDARGRVGPAAGVRAVVTALGAGLLLAGSIACTRDATARARVSLEDVVLPTYPIGPEDRYPKYYELEDSIIYPYAMQDELGTGRVDRTYRAYILENEYLRVMVLPELGGRIQSVFDKRRNAEALYRNHVVKPGLVALRGAWLSGGVEWNRGPQSHTVTTFEPVDVRPVEEPDGSATLVIGATERNFRTGWEVRLSLAPGRAFLAERIRLFNPTDTAHPYYFWNNAAFPNRPGTRFIFPMTLGTDHEGTAYFRWPVHEGRDLTWLRNYPEPTSIFAVRATHDFFGAYDAEADYGIVQTADHRLVPGKKAWTWGEADAGLLSQRALTDDDGPYIEVQSGPLPTQSDYGWLRPGQQVEWHEWWLPVFGLGDGFEVANRDLVASRVDAGGAVELRLQATGTFPGARVVVSRGSTPLLETAVDLHPSGPVPVRLSGEPGAAFDVRVTTADGDPLLAWTSPLPVPRVDPPPAAPSTPDDESVSSPSQAFLLADAADRALARDIARRGYERALALDAGFVPALLALGELDLEAGLLDSARARVERAVALDPRSGRAWHGVAVAALAQGDAERALDAGYEATRTGEPALGYGVVGRALMRLGQQTAAIEALEQGLRYTADANVRLVDDHLLALWAAGRADRARELAATAVVRGTNRLAPHLVHALTTGGSFPSFAAATRPFAGPYEFTCLELAMTLVDLGLEADAARLLDGALVEGRGKAAVGPLPLYYLAWLAERASRAAEARAYRQNAAALSPDLVFPSRPEMVAVLSDAAAREPADGKVRLYLGNLLAGLGRYDEAVAAWTAAVERDASLVVGARNLGMEAWKRGARLDDAIRWLERAHRGAPSDQVVSRDLAQVLVDAGRPADALAVLRSLPADRPRADVVTLLARTLVSAGLEDEAIERLSAVRLSNWEGNTDVWRAFVNAHLARGERRLSAGDAAGALADFDAALTYPPNLGVGGPARPETARVNFWRGRALSALGRREEARQAWSDGAARLPEPASAVQREFEARSDRALQALGRR